MDSGVSWHQVISVMKLRYPNADQSTIIYLAKQYYIANQIEAVPMNQKETVDNFSNKKSKKGFVLQGANI